jgi:hypothetical protein
MSTKACIESWRRKTWFYLQCVTPVCSHRWARGQNAWSCLAWNTCTLLWSLESWETLYNREAAHHVEERQTPWPPCDQRVHQHFAAIATIPPSNGCFRKLSFCLLYARLLVERNPVNTANVEGAPSVTIMRRNENTRFFHCWIQFASYLPSIVRPVMLSSTCSPIRTKRKMRNGEGSLTSFVQNFKRSDTLLTMAKHLPAFLLLPCCYARSYSRDWLTCPKCWQSVLTIVLCAAFKGAG